MVRWNQGKEAMKKKKEKKKSKKMRKRGRRADTAAAEDPPQQQRRDFTAHFRQCLASAREDVGKRRKDALIARFGGTSTSGVRRRGDSRSPTGSRGTSPAASAAAVAAKPKEA